MNAPERTFETYLEPRIWCTQRAGFVCSDWDCMSNIYWDPFNCHTGNDKKTYPNDIKREGIVIDKN